MKTGHIGNTPTTTTQYNQLNKVPKHGKTDQKQDFPALSNPVDTFTLSSTPPRVEGAADPSAIDRLWRETNHAADAIRRLVASMLGNNDASGQGFWAIRAGGNLQLSEADRAQAQQMIGEDGFFGVKQTTERIMDFAKALVGEGASPEQIEKMRSAVQAGFDQVARMFGGFDNLPDVTRQTHAAIMSAFDEWIAAGSAATATE